MISNITIAIHCLSCFARLRAAPPRPSPTQKSKGRRGSGSGSGRAGAREREAKKKSPNKFGKAELRIKVGLPGGQSAVLELFRGDHVVEVAKKFIVDNGLPDTEHVTESLCKKINLARTKKADLAREQMEKGFSNKILGRMEVELSNGTKRSIILRDGDDPELIVEAFTSRHAGQVTRSQKNELVKLLKGEIQRQKMRAKRGF